MSHALASLSRRWGWDMSLDMSGPWRTAIAFGFIEWGIR